MIALLVPTLWIKIPYHRWKSTHEWFGALLVLVMVHIVVVNRNVAAYPVLRYWLYGLLTLTLAGFIYIRFLYRFIGPPGAGTTELALHPEISRDWKSPADALFYLVQTKDQASFDNDIRNEVILSHFHGCPAFEEGGHHYELYEDVRQGFITADYIDGRVQGGVRDKNIFLFGPTPMVNGLIRQFRKMGIHEDQIIIEDFNLV